MSQVDLHIHSTVSDGTLSPAEVVSRAAEAGLTVIALADHDNLDGIAPALEAARSFPQLTVIPGVEISADIATGEAHVLGYFIDYTNPELCDALQTLRDSRLERAQQMIAKLGRLGLPVEWERVREIAGSGSVGRPHIAQAMLEKGYISSMKEAFSGYLGWGKPAYVSRKKMSPAELVKLILRAGGVPVLAHPLTLNEPEALIVELKAHGLAGIEAYYNNYTPEEINRLVTLADQHGLIATGGSDYHGLDNTTETMIGGADVPITVAEKLFALDQATRRSSQPSRNQKK
ncbi:MAG: PHP domain-containing protein [Dehalococcoidales bacterium]|nr:PHP domain-containing protein [Dehalococcoidales bacterium]